MKLCPKCSAKNSNDSRFCNSCGASLEGVAPTSDTANDFLNKAGGLLSDGAKKVKEAASTGTQKVQRPMQDAITRMREQQTSKKANAHICDNMLIDPHETVIASLGNGYVQNIIGNKTVKRGFALLTEKRVYYSGQALSGGGMGTNISTEESIIPVENITRTRFIHNRGIVSLIIGLFLAIYGGIMACFQFASGPDDFLIFLGFGMLMVGICFIAVYFLGRSTVFEISFPGGRFTFDVKWYPLEDMREFQRQIHLVKDKANHTDLGGLN